MIYNFIRTFIILAFCQGLFIYVGISNFFYKQTVFLFTLLIFFFILIISSKNKFDYHQDKLFKTLLIANSLIVIFSFYLNNSSTISSLSYILYFFPGFLFYFFIRKKIFFENQIKSLNKLFFFIFLIQIPASVIKLIVVGQQEAVIGTMHYSAGSLNTIVPLIAISMLFSFYLFFRRKYTFLFLIMGFLFMGWTGEKRGIYFYLIILSFFTIISYSRLQNFNVLSKVKSTFIKIPLLILSLFIILYVGVKFSPTLNPERILGGSFDIEYLINYIYSYSYQTNEDGLGGGRLSALISSFTFFINESDIKTLLFGMGPDVLIGSSFDDGSQYDFGVASFMGINGWTTSLMSTGFLGAITFTLTYLYIMFKTFKITSSETDKYWKATSFGIYLVCFVFLLDFFTYTKASFHSVPLNITLFYFFSVLINRNSLLKYKSKIS